MNVAEVGHLKEQPTKLANFKPQLYAFHGYTFQRNHSTVIEVWIPSKCDFCDCNIRLNSFFVRTGKSTDEEIQRHGLIKFEGSRPMRGTLLHTGSPFYCEACKERWLRGDALEQIEEAIS